MPSETTQAAQERGGITAQDAQMHRVWGAVVYGSPLNLGGGR